MTKIIKLFSLIILVFTFYGCPSGFESPLGNPGEEKIDIKLLGKWVTYNENSEVMSCNISQKDAYYYIVKVIKKNDNLYGLSSDTFKGWITKFEGKQFLCLQPDDQDAYYHFSINKVDAKNMITCEVSVMQEKVKDLKTKDLLGKQVKLMIKNNKFKEDVVTWTKQ